MKSNIINSYWGEKKHLSQTYWVIFAPLKPVLIWQYARSILPKELEIPPKVTYNLVCVNLVSFGDFNIHRMTMDNTMHVMTIL